MFFSQKRNFIIIMKACIIGGGIAGVALSRNLAKAGVAVTVIERGPQLCSGATWHAAGLVTRFAGSPKLKKVTKENTKMISLASPYLVLL